MARKTGMMGSAYVTETRPKKTRQGRGKTLEILRNVP